MPWTINSELYPLSVRGLSTGISTMTNWASNLLISQFFLSVIDAFVGLFPADTTAAAGDKGACERASVRAYERAGRWASGWAGGRTGGRGVFACVCRA
jgi:hypothetical protein